MATETPMSAPRRVAIVGGARTRSLAPYDDPTWDIWAFSSLRLRTPRVTRWFEMHALPDLRSQLRKATKRRHSYAGYMRFLQRLDCPVYMQRTHRTIPNSVRYPLREAVQTFGRCFTSTASYLIALAILEGYDTIGVWGIHLTARSIYARQRPTVEYLLGVARRRGIQVVIPRGVPLRVPARPRVVRTRILYGYDWRSRYAWWRKGRRRTVVRRGRRRTRR